MLKRVFFFAFLLAFFAVPFCALAAPPATFDEAVRIANQEIAEKYGKPEYFSAVNVNGKPLSQSTWQKGLTVGGTFSRVLVYGEPFGMSSYGVYRYLGETRVGEPFTNIEHPIEVWGRNYIEDYDWVAYPWNNPRIRDYVKHEGGELRNYGFDGDPSFRELILKGLMLETYRGKPICGPNASKIPWERYVHIYQPPTQYTWGMGRMWNIGRDGNIYYKTVCLPPYSFGARNLKVLNFAFSKNPTEEGDVVSVSAVVMNECEEDVTTKVRYIFRNQKVDEREITIPAKGKISVSFKITAPSPGQYPAGVLVNPYRDMPSDEANILSGSWPGDNYAGGTLIVKEVKQEGPGSLTFRAVSQNRKIPRPINTAKWTDWVTAELRPPAPVPPRGSLDWWEITSAELTYPKKNPEFTFGTPYPPVGTKTVKMNPNGHVATVEFQEDWAMDGAKIYSILEKKMMAEYPKNYKLTARYTIRYQYSWTECDEDGCWTETRIDTTSGTISGNLLVNGTGVDSRAQ